MKNIFTKHPNSIGETYFQHLRFASQFGITLMIGGMACLIHALFPFLFEKTGSNILLRSTYFFISRMPKLEERVIEISRIIEKKRVTSIE